MGENSYVYIFQKGFNYSQDGPGNRLVYHLSGCNLTCPWCSNPEGMAINPDSQKIAIDHIVAEALSSRMIFIDGGGVTLTGGEVTYQKNAVLLLLNKLKENGIHTCIETNASITQCEEVFDTVDYMIADFKSPSAERLKDVTDASLEVIKNNLIYRAKTGKPLLVRIPLIKHFNCSETDARDFAHFFKELNDYGNGNVFFEILTYHEFGKEKYAKLNKEYTVTDGYVTDNDVKLLLQELKAQNLKTINT